MTSNVAELFRVASELPESERAELAGLLLDSLGGEPEEGVEVAWANEVERRIRQIDAGEVETIPWEEVRARLFAQLDGRR